jgi:hypothetical protein
MAGPLELRNERDSGCDEKQSSEQIINCYLDPAGLHTSLKKASQWKI